MTVAAAATIEDIYGTTSLLKQPPLMTTANHVPVLTNVIAAIPNLLLVQAMPPYYHQANDPSDQIAARDSFMESYCAMPRINCPFQTFASFLLSILPILNT